MKRSPLVVPAFFLFILSVMSTKPVCAQALPGGGTAKSKGMTVDVKDVGDFPQEAAVVEHFSRKYKMENDGTGTLTTHVEYKVQSDAGVQELGVLQIGYNSVSEEVKIDYVHVKKPDGVVINTPTESAQEATNNVSQVAPMYTDMKIRYLPIVGLRPGDKLEYQITTTTKKPVVPGQFFVTASFEKDAIVKDEVLEMDIPAARKIKLKTEQGATPQIKEENGRKIYRWESTNLVRKDPKKKGQPEAKEEGDEDEKSPSIQATTFDSWQEVGKWYWDLQSNRLTTSPEMKAKVAELTKDAKSDTEKVSRIYDFVAKEFRYIGLEFGVGRYQPHDAAEVFAARYGDCKDKHTVLAAMLKAAGFDAMPVLINSSRKLDTELPSPSQFDHVISLVRLKDHDMWMDTTSEVAPLGMLMGGLRKKNALLAQAGEGSKITETPADAPVPIDAKLELEGTINDLGRLNASVRQSWRGSDMEVLLRSAFRRTPEAQWVKLAQNLSYAGGWSGEVSDVKVGEVLATEKPFEYSYKYEREGYVDWKQATGEMRIGLTSIGLPAPPDKKSGKPKAIPFGGTGQLYRVAKVRLPAGTSAFAPEAVHLIRDFAEYHSTYKFQDGLFIAERKLILKMREVPPSLEGDYEAFYREVTEDENKQANVWRKAGGIAEIPKGSTADELRDAGESAIRQRDFATAAKVYGRLTELEPKDPTAWAGLGMAQMSTMKVDDAIKSFRKQIEVNPSHETAHLMLATALGAQRKYDEAIDVLKKKLEKDPKDPRARVMLATTYADAGKTKEAIPFMEESLKEYPDDQNLQYRLANAYLDTGDKDKALAAYEQVLKSTPTPLMKNNIAYAIADKNMALDKAEHYAKEALADLSEHMRSADLEHLSPDDLAQNNLQIAAWDTLGWIYKQEGKLKEAEDYCRAAWSVRQDREVADHLAEIYHLEGKSAEEKKMKDMAQSIKMPPKTLADAMDRAKGLSVRETQALQDMRTIKLTRKVKKTLSGEMFIMFSATGQVDDIKLMNASDDFKSWTPTFKSLDYRTELPSGEKTKLLRRAVVSCAEYNGECMLVMLPQNTVVSPN